MLERLQEVAVTVRDLDEGLDLYRRILGMEPCHAGELPAYGLNNLVLPAGKGTFIELLQPTTSDSAAARFLERRGEAPYCLIFETQEYDRLIPHLRSLGVRITRETQAEDVQSAFIHPSSANEALLEVVEVSSPSNPWPPAGDSWYK